MHERVGIISLGCSRNTVDSEKILNDWRRRGARISPSDKADTVLLNTCAFTKDAKQESIDCLLDLVELKKKGRIKKIIVYGCLVERYSRELKENFGDVDGFFGISDFKRQFDARARLTPRHFAYLKISEGCANCCSYCAIPSIKGPFRSRSEASILREVEFLEKKGVRELNIIGQDITLYGQDAMAPLKNLKLSRQAAGLARLVRKIIASSDIPWIRLLYLNPLRVSDEILDLIAQEDRLCPYLDIPLQHVNNRMLKLMNRAIDQDAIRALIGKIRRRLPQAALRSTFILGFPSETEKEFRELLDFTKIYPLDRCGAFMYSAEEGTKAYSFKNRVSDRIMERRYHVFMEQQKSISARLLKKNVGCIAEVIIDEDRRKIDGYYIGRTKKDAPEVDGVVYVKSLKPLKRGALVRAKITDSYEYDLCAEAVVARDYNEPAE